jgi:hypothetical protein
MCGVLGTLGNMRRVLIEIFGWIVFTLIGSWLLRKAPAKLMENAMSGWIDDKIGEYLNLTAPETSTVVTFLWEWGLPAIVAVTVLYSYHLVQKYYGQQHRSPALEDKGGAEQISLANLCCYLAAGAAWSEGQVTHSPAFAVHIGNEIRDAAYQSKIEGFGRSFDPTRPNWLGQKAALGVIPANWWSEKYIDSWRSLKGETTGNTVYDDSQQQSGYHDIKFNLEGVQHVWPRMKIA